MGFSHQQRVHLSTLESASLVTARVMGSVEYIYIYLYIRTLCQHLVPQGPGDETDVKMDSSDDGSNDAMLPEVPTASTPSSAESVFGMVEFLKAEHLGCLVRGELWDANAIQRVILNFLEDVHESSGRDMVTRCQEKVAFLFSELKERAIVQNPLDSADRYQMISSMFGPD